MSFLSRNLLFQATFLLGTFIGSSQSTGQQNFTILKQGYTPEQIISKAAHITPSARQLEWQRMEMAAFIHFGMNTFTGLEWGDGKDDPSLFNPAALDPRQWVKVLQDAGFRMIILTAKHHDGFCLWPSEYTNYSVAASSWKAGKGDVVREVSDACHAAGMKFGIYLSPWDRHEPSYGNSPEYNRHFLDQLRELLTNYGAVDEVWFDGACVEGPNGKKQVYDWESYYALVRELQPQAVIAVSGPDVRWVGTESGYGRTTEWSVVDADETDMMKEDLGSRERIMKAKRLAWYPSEVDVSIRPGWFYHESEDSLVKSPARLFDIYMSSVGRNSGLLLNVPPDKRGLIADSDISSLKGMRQYLDDVFGKNLIPGEGSKNITREWHGDTLTITCDLGKAVPFNILLLGEDITQGQRVEVFTAEARINGKWSEAARGTTIGYKRLLAFPEVTADQFRVTITNSRARPEIENFGLFLDDH